MPDIERVVAYFGPPYEKKWIAVAADYSRVIAAATTLDELFELVTDDTAIFCYVAPRDTSLAS
jgi:hypothetical protein